MNTKSAQSSFNIKNVLVWIVWLSIVTIFLYVMFLQKEKEIRHVKSANLPGDCDGDGFVDLFDYGYLSRSFGLAQGQQGFDGRCDFYQDSNSIIDLFDYQILANNFGRTSITPSTTPLPGKSFQTGWWVNRDQGNPSILATYSSQGNSLVLLTGGFCYQSQLAMTKSYLDEAQRQGMKAIVGLTCSDNTPYPITVSDFTSIINSLKNYPALYGYYIGDEPEFSSDQAEIQRRHNYLKTDPGYYRIIKNTDPNHPVLLSFNQPYNEQQWTNQTVFYDVTDIIGIHAYPFWSTGGEFGTSEGRTIYDIWKRGFSNARSLGKDFIATAQGFGNGHGFPYKTPTTNELRYEVFTAIVQGINKVLFWMDTWGDTSNMKPLVALIIGQVQAIGAEMNDGITNDPRISVSITDRNQLVYRYGESTTRHIILAVNIASRTSSSGATLSNVRFQLPSGINSSQVTVLSENRTIPISTDKSFTDTFTPFSVHIYSF